ncbi:Histone deacetylase hda1 [Agyrium rufum]|nr:Histone deacetylase hda1 [Agyrium rufum]
MDYGLPSTSVVVDRTTKETYTSQTLQTYESHARVTENGIAHLVEAVSEEMHLDDPTYPTSGSSDTASEINGSGPGTVIVRNALPHSSLPTGLCYDARMRFHCELDPPKDRSNFHPEDPRRIQNIYKALCKAGLVKDARLTPPECLVAQPMARIDARPVEEHEVCLVHTKKHWDYMQGLKFRPNQDLTYLEKQEDSIYFHQLTPLSAGLSAGGAIETCCAVVRGEVKNAIAVIRPPGHHAETDRPMGFCIFDNVSIATRVCQQEYPETCRKVMILDWDVHHGNGIQQAFEHDPNVLYISIHVHENGNFYPQGPAGDHLHCGLGEGIGKNINIPWPKKGMGDAEYIFAFQNIVMPVAQQFDPDLVIIAAGFDAADGDQLGGCHVTPPAYAHMTHMLMSLANGKLVVCLEGGYNLTAISNSALAVTQTLMGEPPGRLAATVANQTAVALVKKVVSHQSKFWSCLYPKNYDVELRRLFGAERMHDVIRTYQSKILYDSHKMIPLFILQERLSKSFENQVLATSNYAEARPLLVIFHDPPEMIGIPDPVTNRLDLHNTWLTDVSKDYITWAIRQGYAVINVNIPQHLTGIEDDPEAADLSEDEKPPHIAAMEELVVYLWENYIEPNDSTKVFFLGIGDAYNAVLHLLNTRNESALQLISGVSAFLSSTTLRRVNDTFVSYLSKWYPQQSLIFLEHTHAVWRPEREKRPSRKFGTLVKSDVDGLNAMLLHHKSDFETFVQKKIGDFMP